MLKLFLAFLSSRRALAAFCAGAWLLVSAPSASAVSYQGFFDYQYMRSTSGVAVNPKTGDVFVTSRALSLVFEFTRGGAFKAEWGEYGAVKTKIHSPIALAFGPDGTLFILSRAFNNVWKGTAAGVHQLTFGGSGTGNGQFEAPSGIAADEYNNVYVTDRKFGTVTKFDNRGRFVKKWQVPRLSNPSQPARGLEAITADIVSPRNGLTDAFLYVVDSDGGCVFKYDTQGNLLRTFGSKGTARGQLSNPMGVAVDEHGLVYVADRVGPRIEVFEPDGSPSYFFNGFAAAGITYFGPTKIAFNKGIGTMYVLTDIWPIVTRFRIY